MSCAHAQAGVKKTKVGTVIPNNDQKLPNGRYSRKQEKVFKNITVFRVSQRDKFKKIQFL